MHSGRNYSCVAQLGEGNAQLCAITGMSQMSQRVLLQSVLETRGTGEVEEPAAASDSLSLGLF